MNDSRRIRVLLVDDDEVIRLGLRACLQSDVSVTVIGDAASAAQAVVQAVRLTPNVVLMEARLPDGSGIDACRQIRARAPSVQVMIVSDAVDVIAAVQAGAAGFLSKRSRAVDVSRAVRTVAGGGAVLDSAMTAALLDYVRRAAAAARDGGLTTMERQILALIVEGKTNKEISARLGLSEKTIKVHLSHVFAKLHVSRRSEAAVIFAFGGAAPIAVNRAPGSWVS